MHSLRSCYCSKFFVQSLTDQLLKVVIVTALALILTGCTLIKKAVELPTQGMRELITGLTPAKPIDLVALQDSLLRYADVYILSISRSIDKLELDGKPMSREQQVTYKLRFISDMMSLATGANALGNLINMVIYVSTMRTSIQEYWMPNENGISEIPLLNILRASEENIWAIAAQWLTADQRLQLQEAIEHWQKTHRTNELDQNIFADISLVNSIVSSSEFKAPTNSQSVFSLLDLDPLAGLDPATREITDTRLLGERALFLTKRMPKIIEWQMELLTAHSMENPKIQGIVASASQLAAAGDRMSHTLEQTPSFISSERKKIIAELKSEQNNLTELSRQLGQTLGEGSRMIESTDKALQTFGGIMTQMDNKSRENIESKPNSINEYIEMAVRIEGMSLRLTELLRTLQPSLEPASVTRITALADALAKQTQQTSKEFVDYAINKTLTLVVLSSLVISLAVVMVFLICKYLSIKITRSMARPTSDPPNRGSPLDFSANI